ncbi:MAG: hypothetical protein AB7J35_01385 [Dehalococcoidia bacterium]
MPDRRLVTFDMDGVLCRPPFGINPGTGKGKRRDAPGKKGILWRTESWRYQFRKPMPGAVEGFRSVAKHFECAVLTARGEPARDLTTAWFDRYFGLVPALHIRPHWDETSAQFKARKLGELEPLAHFEDDPFTAEWAAELVEAVFLIDWKRNRKLSGPNIHRVSSITEAIPTLEQLAAR